MTERTDRIARVTRSIDFFHQEYTTIFDALKDHMYAPGHPGFNLVCNTCDDLQGKLKKGRLLRNSLDNQKFKIQMESLAGKNILFSESENVAQWYVNPFREKYNITVLPRPEAEDIPLNLVELFENKKIHGLIAHTNRVSSNGILEAHRRGYPVVILIREYWEDEYKKYLSQEKIPYISKSTQYFTLNAFAKLAEAMD